MSTVVVKRSQMITAEISGVPSAGQTYRFTNIEEINQQNAVVYGIEALTTTQLLVDPYSANSLISAAGALSIVANFVIDGQFKNIKRQPLFTMIRSSNAGIYFSVANLKISFIESNIELVAATALAQNEVAAFQIYYYLANEK